MPTHTPQRSEQLQQGLQNFALFIRRGRELNGLSQQNLHVFFKILLVNIYNSQLSHMEQGKLILKPATFLELEKGNFAIDDKKNIPPTQKDFSKEVREKFLQATPYLNVDGEVCDATDFFRIFVGIDDLHKSYKSTGLDITDEHAHKTTEYARNIFLGYCQENMLSRPEGWENLLPELEKIMKQKKQKEHFKNILSGLEEWTTSELKAYTKDGTIDYCPINRMFETVTHKQMPECRDVWTKGDKVKYSQLQPLR
jgi:hypothetical protein